MTSPFTSNQFCSILSEQAGEALIGTAPHVETYLLLEYLDPPGKNALEESLIPAEVKTFLEEGQKFLPHPRVQLVRGPHPPFGSGPRLFIAHTTDTHPRLYRLQLKSYEELLQLDLNAFIRGDQLVEQFRQHEPIFVICTNARRDPCCAKFGLPVFNELAGLLGGFVWQSSHFGGHRFAPNLLILPHGLMFGRLGTRSAVDVVQAYQRNEIELPHLRGRVGYPAPAQAAEYFIRQETGDFRLDAFHFQEMNAIEPGLWKVIFMQPHSGKKYPLTIRMEVTDEKVYESCQSEKQGTVTRYLSVKSL